jgi:hypothetical protein
VQLGVVQQLAQQRQRRGAKGITVGLGQGPPHHRRGRRVLQQLFKARLHLGRWKKPQTYQGVGAHAQASRRVLPQRPQRRPQLGLGRQRQQLLAVRHVLKTAKGRAQLGIQLAASWRGTRRESSGERGGGIGRGGGSGRGGSGHRSSRGLLNSGSAGGGDRWRMDGGVATLGLAAGR